VLTPKAELAHGWRRQPPLQTLYSYKGPDTPAGFTFFGLPVYRTFVMFGWSGSGPASPTVIPGFNGLVDVVDIWGSAQAAVSGAVQGSLNVMGWVNNGWNGASAVRLRIDPALGNLEIFNSLGEFGASESWGWPNSADIEFILFWTK
jgi:hypothetical protein